MTTDTIPELDPEFFALISKMCETRFSGRQIIDVLFILIREKLSARYPRFDSPEEMPNSLVGELLAEAQSFFVLESVISELISRCDILEEQVAQLTLNINKMSKVIDIMNSVDGGK